jgi:hypothetical protein
MSALGLVEQVFVSQSRGQCLMGRRPYVRIRAGQTGRTNCPDAECSASGSWRPWVSLCNTIFLHNLVASVFAAILTVVSIGSSQAMNGGTWYDNCSKWAYSKKDEIAASPVEKRLAYRECQIEAIKAWCDQGWEGDATNV